VDLTYTVDLRGIRRVRVALERFPKRLASTLKVANRNSSAVALRRVKQKVSGQVLQVRTGNLRRGWTMRQPEPLPGEIGFLGGIGTAVEYDPIHEFGFEGSVSVRAHSRQSKGGKAYDVRAHARQVSVPARPHARPAMLESRPEIQAFHEKAVTKALDGGGEA